MVRFFKFVSPLWGFLLLYLLSSCGKVDTPNVADPFANLTGKSLGFDVDPPYFESDANGNQKGLDSAIPGACGNLLLQWTSASDAVTTNSSNISYLIYQAGLTGSEDFSSPTYQVPAGTFQVSQGELKYLVKNLLPGTTYYFVIRARDEAENLSVIDPNHLVEQHATTAGIRDTGAGPNLYCPGGYAGESVVLTGTSVGSATTAIFSATPSPVSASTSTISTTEVRAIIPSGIQSGPIQLTSSGGTTADRFLFFPSGTNISSDATASTNPSIALSGTNIGIAWTDSYQGKERILFSLSTDGGGTFSYPAVVSDPSRFSSAPQVSFGSGTTPPIYIVWSDLDAASKNSDIYFTRSLTNGSSFSTPVNISSNAGESFHPRMVSSGNNVSVVWDDNSVLYGLTSVWGSDFKDVYAVGKGGNIYHTVNQGNTWVKQLSNTTATLNGVWGSGANDVYAVGAGGTILYNGGSGWTPTTVGTANLNGVWGNGAGDVCAVGNGGTILHYTTALGWTSATVGTADLNGVWESGANDVYAVGAGGTILHNGGSGWTSTTVGSANLNGVWGSGAGDVYAVGNGGTILHYTTALGWTSTTVGTANLYAVWGSVDPSSGTQTIYAMGDQVLRKSGTLPWEVTTLGISGGFTVTGLWGLVTSGGSNIYGVQGDGPILQWTGINWSYLVPDQTTGEIFYLQIANSGSTFGSPPLQVSAASPGARAGNPDLIWSGTELYVVWTESLMGLSLSDPRDQSSIHIGQKTANDINFTIGTAASPGLCHSFKFPRLAQNGSTVFAVWQDSFHYYIDPNTPLNSCVTFDHSFDQIRLAQPFTSPALPSSLPSQVISPPVVSPIDPAILTYLGSSMNPALAVSGQNLVVVWTDTGQGKRELFLVSSPNGGGSFTPPANFSSPFTDNTEESDSAVLISDGNGHFFMVWEQTMIPVGILPGNRELFFSHF